MNSYGQITEAETIRFERILAGPIKYVWDYLIESEKRGQWLAAGDMEPHEGGKVELIFNHDDLTPHEDPVPEKYKDQEEGSRMEGTITEIDPPRLLSYTWGEDAGFDSEVTFELDPQGNDVLLTLTHRQLGRDHELIKGIAAGWHTHLNILADRLQGRTPDAFWATHMQLEEEYAKRL